jgi:small-conductance mechanosensitive channel
LWPRSQVLGQGEQSEPNKVSGIAAGEIAVSPAAKRVDVRPTAPDEEIKRRLQNVLEATTWFQSPRVEVEEGVAFLSGTTSSNELKKWAGDLAQNTQDVVAVANRIEVLEGSPWDFEPALTGLREIWQDFTGSIHFAIFGFFVLALSLGAGLLATRGAKAIFLSRIRARLLQDVLSRGIGVLVFLLGVYVVLRVSGLTQLALTIVGGTGLIGLAVGIAFRDITENFLASIFLSMQKPFETGDLVAISGVTGYVQQLNVRTTVLMTLDGNLVQIPNATVYKTIVRNYTSNGNRREDFVVGIGYGDSIDNAQEVARKVLEDHPAVLGDPEPSVLVDELGSSTINLRIYFWLDGKQHSWLKVRSSVIRLIKFAFQKNGISMPDEAREIVFPNGVPVTMLDPNVLERANSNGNMRSTPNAGKGDSPSTRAEGGLESEADVIEQQARRAQIANSGENLLKPTSSLNTTSKD